MMKSRDQSIREFVHSLHLEYITAQLRKDIYTRSKDKDYYSRVMEVKRSKILDICLKNSCESMFNLPSLSKEFYGEVYVDWGIPNFTYASETERLARQYKDISYYFKKGTDVSVKMSQDEVGWIERGVIVSCSIKNRVVEVRLRGGKTISTLMDYISRS